MTRSPNDHQGTALTYCRMAVFATVSLCILIFLVYSNSFHCSWHFDDAPNITENPLLHMTKISWHSIQAAIFSDRNNPAMPYRPVACLSFALNYYFGGLHVAGYHLVNILIHLISSIFLFLFIYRTLTLPTFRQKYGPSAYFIALLSTVLWAINPIQTQAITYIVQRMASLAAMFYIMAMYFYLKGRVAGPGRKKIFSFLMCAVSFLLAMSSKENAAMLPLSLLLFEMLILQQDTLLFFRKNLLKLAIVLGLTLVIGLAYLFIKSGNAFSFLNGYENRPFTLGQRLLTEPRIILLYISLLFYPMPDRLNIAHDITISTSLLHPISTLFSIVIIAGSIAGAMLFSKKRPFISFALLFFFLNHLIESSIFPLELIFEHRNYLPSMFLFVPVAMGLHFALQTYTAKKSMEIILSSFIILVLIGFGHSTFMRNFAWKNEKSMWIDAAEKSPNLSRPHHNLGRYYQDHGYYQKAIQEYQKALESPFINRRDSVFVTYYNLGKIYAHKKDYKIAESFYDKALALKADFPPLFNDMAALFDKEGDPQLAHEYLIKALKLSPHDLFATFNLGFHYLQQGKPAKAISYLRKLPENDKSFGERLPLYLGIAYKQTGRLGRAAVFFGKTIKRNPKNIKAHIHLAEVFYTAGKKEWAEREMANAVDLIGDERLFEKILRDMTGKSKSQNLQPRKEIIIPLMKEVLLKKSERLKKWAEKFLAQ
ncbi:MAG: tetratricopeptide repeat protein [Deltaproteobacteria bacterium]|nr:tetratricopeptide repeat protein [Deltaproteobacteria bacterium]